MLENNRSFFRRHIGNSAQEQKKMLNELGYKDIKELISKTVPENIHFKDYLTYTKKKFVKKYGTYQKIVLELTYRLGQIPGIS